MNGPGPDFRHGSTHGRHRAGTAARRQPLAAGDAIRSFYFIPPFPPPQAQPSPPRGGFWETQPHWQFPRANPLPVPHPSSDTGRAEWPSQFEPSLPPRPLPPANLLPSASRMQSTPHVIPDPQPGLPPVNRLPPPPGGGEWPAQFRPKPNPQPKPLPVSGPHLTAIIEERPPQILLEELSHAPMSLPAPSRAIAGTGKAVERPPQHRPPAQSVAIAERSPAPVKGKDPEPVRVPVLQNQPAERSSAEQVHPSKQDESPSKVADEPVQPEQPVATSPEKPAQLHQTARTSIEKKSLELDQIAKPSVDKPARPEEHVGIATGKAAQLDQYKTATGSAPGRRDQPVTSLKPLRGSASRPQAASHGGVSKRAPRKGFKPESGVNYKGRGAFYGGMLGDTPESQEEMREQDAEMARRADEQRARQVKDKPWMYGEMWARGESPPPAPRRAGTGHRKQGQ